MEVCEHNVKDTFADAFIALFFFIWKPKNEFHKTQLFVHNKKWMWYYRSLVYFNWNCACVHMLSSFHFAFKWLNACACVCVCACPVCAMCTSYLILYYTTTTTTTILFYLFIYFSIVNWKSPHFESTVSKVNWQTIQTSYSHMIFNFCSWYHVEHFYRHNACINYQIRQSF